MIRKTDGWIEQYKQKGAFWIHDGNPQRPHALLTSGKHSSGFFNSELVMEDSILLDEACFDLVRLLEREGVTLNEVDRVVGPAMGAITLAHDISRHIGRARDRFCLRAYTEKETDDDGRKIMTFKKTAIRSGELILAVEDVLTTGGSVELTSRAVWRSGGTLLPFVAVLVNRSGLTEVDGKKIVALIDRPMPMWAPDECPLCKEGSEAIRPKGTENWSRLNAPSCQDCGYLMSDKTSHWKCGNCHSALTKG